MKQIPLERYPLDAKHYLRRSPAESDTARVYDEPGIYTLGGEPVIIYGRLGARYDKMLWAVKTLGFLQEIRSSGGISPFDRDKLKAGKNKGLGASRIFGYRPPVRYNYCANYCAPSSSAYSHPAQHAVICEFGRLLDSIYGNFAPDVAARHSELLRSIRAEWIIPGTRFTSGIVNRANPLKYHFDRGNLEKVMSCMVVFRHQCDGGFLSIPEFGGRWPLEDHSFFLFDGQSHLHGVTPIRRLNKRAYRYSVVYYALQAMAKCGGLDEELSRARAEKRARERRRV